MFVTFLLLTLLIAVVSVTLGEMALQARRRRQPPPATPEDREAWARKRRKTRPTDVEQRWYK